MIGIGFYQFAPRFGRVRENLAKVTAALGKAEADLVVLPELPFTGYSFRDRKELDRLAEVPGESPVVAALVDLCRRRDFHLVTGFAEKKGRRIFNSALLVGPEGIVSVYRKLHLFDREKEYFDPGNKPFAVNEVRGIRVGMMLCFDWAFPEAARVLALEGAGVICHPANLVLDFCQQAMTVRCLENALFAVTANRTGTEARPHGALRFTGRSQIVAPGGKVIYRSGPRREELYIASLDIDPARDKRITERNDLLADRRPEVYERIGRPRVRG